MHPESSFQIAPNRPWIGKMTMTSYFSHIAIFFFFWRFFVSLMEFSYWFRFMSISSLVLELWQFSFIGDWPEIRNSEIPPSEFCLISGDWGKLRILNFLRISTNKMLLNAAKCQGYSLYRFWVLEEKPTVGVNLPPPHPD